MFLHTSDLWLMSNDEQVIGIKLLMLEDPPYLQRFAGELALVDPDTGDVDRLGHRFSPSDYEM